MGSLCENKSSGGEEDVVLPFWLLSLPWHPSESKYSLFNPFLLHMWFFLLDTSIAFPACQPGILIKDRHKDRDHKMLLQILTVLNRLQNCNSASFPAWCCLCRPKNGGKYCVGRRMKFKSCNTEPCSKLKKDFRDEQCADFDGKHFNINGLPTNVRWVPKYSGSKWLGGCRSCLLNRCRGVRVFR